MGKKAPLDWEFSSFWVWMAFGREKPFPVSIYRKGGVWEHTAHPHRDLSAAQQDAIAKFVGERAVELTDQYAAFLSVRLNWPNLELRNSNDDTTDDE